MTQEPKDKIPFFYLLLYSRIKKRTTGNYTTNAIVLEVVKRNLHANMPHSHYYIILKELEIFGLIRRINRANFEIIGGNRDLELTNYINPLWG